MKASTRLVLATFVATLGIVYVPLTLADPTKAAAFALGYIGVVLTVGVIVWWCTER